LPQVIFTRNLQRHVDAPEAQVAGATVREALDAVFALHPRLRGYVVDEQGALRKHMVIFIDKEQIHDRDGLSDAVSTSGTIYVFQALSGG
jgi:hypothetical protein